MTNACENIAPPRAGMAARPDNPCLYEWLVVAALSAAMGLSLIDRFALSLLFQPIKTDLGLSDTELGLLQGVAFGICYAAMGIPLGRLVDAWSRKWVIFGGLALWSACTAASGLAGSYLQLMAARIGVGAGEAALAPAGYSIITDIMPRRRLGTAISTFQMGSLVGTGMAFLLGGALYSLLSGWDRSNVPLVGHLAAWQLTFIVLALLGIPFLLLLPLVREPPRTAVLHPAADTDLAVADEPVEPGVFVYLWTRRRLFGSLFLGSGALVGVSYAIVSWAPTLLAREWGWSLADVGMRIGLITLTAAPAGVLTGGLLADRWSQRYPRDAFARVLLLAAGLTLPLLLLTQLVRSSAQLFILIAVVQFTTGLAIGIGPAVTQTLARSQLRGRVSAVYVLTINVIGLGLGPISIGALSDHVFTGERALLHSLGSYCLAMCGVSVVLLWYFKVQCALRPAGQLQRVR